MARSKISQGVLGWPLPWGCACSAIGGCRTWCKWKLGKDVMKEDGKSSAPWPAGGGEEEVWGSDLGAQGGESPGAGVARVSDGVASRW